MPAATFLHGRRTPWSSAPPELHAWVAEQLGGEIVDATDCAGGMSVGLAAVVHTATTSAFVKGLDGQQNPDGQQIYRREARMASMLPTVPEIPALIADGDVAGTSWTVNILQAAPGRTPVHPWRMADLVAVLDAWARITPAVHATEWPVGEPLPEDYVVRWQSVLADPDDPWHDRAATWGPRLPATTDRIAGDTSHPPVLTHLDLRADNILIGRATPTLPVDTAAGGTPPAVWFVDWAFPALGAPWLDPAILFTDVVASGADLADGGEVDVITLWQSHPATAPYDVELMIGIVVAMGFGLHVGTNRPPGALFPHQRAWERAMADGIAPFMDRQLR